MRGILLIFFTLVINVSVAQNIPYARKIIDTLTSSHFWGRSYANEGLSKAANFIAKEFQLHGLTPVEGKSFLQQFPLSLNIFPGKMNLEINGRSLVPGKDFIISPESKGIKAKLKLGPKDSVTFVDADARVYLKLADKLTWSVSTHTADYTSLIVNKSSLNADPQTVKLNIENRFVSNFPSYNVCGIVKGTVNPDSLIVISAHYDHLGGMGSETYFPGANDNASGIALLLDLASYYAQNPAKYSIAFLCFSAEEAGLIGSKYFSENPLFELNKVRFLINADIVGTGEEGITVVNATEFKNEFALLNKLNDDIQGFAKVYSRGKAANSDHYWFTQKGVPSFFIYTMGGIRAYHDIYDKPDTLPLTGYDNLFRLIVRFNEGLMNGMH